MCYSNVASIKNIKINIKIGKSERVLSATDYRIR